ncbi:hypothetical protein N4E63_14985 [Pseudomonas putida]|nr:hypothetical protein [Pseudomonas putida]
MKAIALCGCDQVLYQQSAQPLALPLFMYGYGAFAQEAAGNTGIPTDPDLAQLPICMDQGNVGFTLVMIHWHMLRIQARDTATEPGNKAETPGLEGDRAEKAAVSFAVFLAQGADQYGSAVRKLFDPMFARVWLFGLLPVHVASRSPDRCLPELLYRAGRRRF